MGGGQGRRKRSRDGVRSQRGSRLSETSPVSAGTRLGRFAHFVIIMTVTAGLSPGDFPPGLSVLLACVTVASTACVIRVQRKAGCVEKIQAGALASGHSGSRRSSGPLSVPGQAAARETCDPVSFLPLGSVPRTNEVPCLPVLPAMLSLTFLLLVTRMLWPILPATALSAQDGSKSQDPVFWGAWQGQGEQISVRPRW